MYKIIAHRGNDDDLAENSKEAILYQNHILMELNLILELQKIINL